jgi:phosphoenolpyruvate synthase/pyruvate phosphate dikinase
MTNAGFHVPGGFLVTTAAYRSFVADNNMQDLYVVSPFGTISTTI